jgi:hypothetical protein
VIGFNKTMSLYRDDLEAARRRIDGDAFLVVEACGGAPMLSAEIPSMNTGIGFDEVVFEAVQR